MAIPVESMPVESMVEQPVADTATLEEDWARGRLVLPGGVVSETGRYRVVHVRELTGRDEELLSDRRYQNGVQQVTNLLTQVIENIEGLDEEITKEVVANLLIGDRDYILLRLRQINLGDDVHQVVHCPIVGCGKKVDVDFRISELPINRVATLRSRYEVNFSKPAISDDPSTTKGFLRLPTGKDLKYITDLAELNPARANTRLFSRLLFSLGRINDVDEELVRRMHILARQELTEFIRARSPGPDLAIDICCPHCGADMSYAFDLESFFLPRQA